jgi:hypothetical protein
MPFFALTSCSKNDETTTPDLPKSFINTVSTFANGTAALANGNYINS